MDPAAFCGADAPGDIPKMIPDSDSSAGKKDEEPGRNGDPIGDPLAADFSRDASDGHTDSAARNSGTSPDALPAARKARGASKAEPSSPGRPGIHVPVDPPDLPATIPITPEEADTLKHRRQLVLVIHRILTLGLIASTVSILTGLALDAIRQRTLPREVPRITEVASQIWGLQPSGFLSLGLLILIATPILRVMGSFAAFVHERDWRYVGVTAIVLVIILASVLSGGG
jgi:uncharacterized membrane protein